MSQLAIGDRVKYVGAPDGALRPGAQGRVVQAGDEVVTVDFGGSVGRLPVPSSDVRKTS